MSTIAFRELTRRTLAKSFELCLPRPAKTPPSGPAWIHEIKHDGFRILARKDGGRVELMTRNGYDFADRYPLIVDAIARLPVRTCIIDGEAIVVDQNGLATSTCSAIASMTTLQRYAPSTFWTSTARTCGQALSRNASST
jgi:ATP-dependent DNA ligase